MSLRGSDERKWQVLATLVVVAVMGPAIASVAYMLATRPLTGPVLARAVIYLAAPAGLLIVLWRTWVGRTRVRVNLAGLLLVLVSLAALGVLLYLVWALAGG